MGTALYTGILAVFIVLYIILFFLRMKNPSNYKFEAGIHFGIAVIWVVMLLGRVQRDFTSVGGKIFTVMGVIIIVLSVLNGMKIVNSNKK